MAWGVEALWATHTELRLGIIDAVHLRHLKAVSPAIYDTKGGWQQALQLLAATGVDTWADLQRITDIWRSGDLMPPWLGSWSRAMGVAPAGGPPRRG